MSMQIKEWVKALAVYEPGRPIEEVAREHGFASADEIIKLASNENSLGPSRKAVKAIKDAARAAHLYPDGGSFYIRQALSKRLNLPPECLMMGHGSNEIIALLGQVLLDPGTTLVMADRAFAIYVLVAALSQAEAVRVPMRAYTHDLDAMLAAIDSRTRLVFVANPNNPTGTMVGGAAIDRFMERVPQDVTVVFDEAYIELLPPELQPDTLRYVREGRNVFVLRTFSKTYGLAGLRIGYAAAPREGIAALDKVRQPFNVNSIAQAAALAALDDDAHVSRTRRMVAAGLRQLERSLEAMGLEYVPSVANFMLVRVGRGREMFEALQRKRVIVRPMDGYGLPEFIRVSVGTRQENDVFIARLREALAERGPS